MLLDVLVGGALQPFKAIRSAQNANNHLYIRGIFDPVTSILRAFMR
jgi:hypothetical protein